MNPVLLSAFQDELEKIALDDASIRQLLRAAKARSIKFPKRFNRSSIALLPGKNQVRGVNREHKKVIKDSWSVKQKHISDIFHSRINAADAMFKKTPSSGAIVVPSRGDFVRFARLKMGQLSPRERMYFNALGVGHELAEAQSVPAFGMWDKGHISPDVMLREHNMITTLPADVRRVADRLVEFRRRPGGEAEILEKALPGFRFGEGGRLSRHKRRKMTEQVRQDTAQFIDRTPYFITKKSLSGKAPSRLEGRRLILKGRPAND